jgi:heptosyltransferase III
MRNILIIKLRYIGDVLLSTPVIRAIRTAYPNAIVTAAVNRGTESVLALNPDVDEVLIVERRSLLRQLRFALNLRSRRFDCVLDLTDGDRSAILCWFSGASVRIGFNLEHRWRGRLYTSLVEPRGAHRTHQIERNLAALRPLGVEAVTRSPVLNVSQDDEKAARQVIDEIEQSSSAAPLVMLQPGARYWFKAWPVERFAELADRLSSAYKCRVLIGGDRSELPDAEKIQQLAHCAPIVVTGRLTLLQFAAILKHCSLFVGNDSGAMHIAAAMGTPLVALFGPSDPVEWGPRGTSAQVVYKGLDCRSCYRSTCTRDDGSCMKLISVDEVYAMASRQLDLQRTVLTEYDHV